MTEQSAELRQGITGSGDRTHREFDQIITQPGLLADLVLAAAGGDATVILRAAASYQDAIHGITVTGGRVMHLDMYRTARPRK